MSFMFACPDTPTTATPLLQRMEGRYHMSNRSEQARKIDSANDGESAPLAGRFGRRALMLGAAAAGAGAAASLVGGTAEAAPTSGIALNKTTTTSGSTVLISKKGTGFSGHTSTHGQAGISGIDKNTVKGSFGLLGESDHGTGILGLSHGGDGITGQTVTKGKSGVAGLDFSKDEGAHGVYGQSNLGVGVFGISFGDNGIFGQSQTVGKSAVVGVDLLKKAGGNAVFAQSHHGTAVAALSDAGVALHVEGRAKFKNSGTASVPAGQNSVKVTVGGLTTANIVLATIQNPQAGVFIEGAQPGAGSFTITLSKKAPSAVHVGWFVIG